MSRKTILFSPQLSGLCCFTVCAFGCSCFGFCGRGQHRIRGSWVTPFFILLILVGCLVGSFINSPVFKLKTKIPMIRDQFATWFGVTTAFHKLSMEKPSLQ